MMTMIRILWQQLKKLIDIKKKDIIMPYIRHDSFGYLLETADANIGIWELHDRTLNTQRMSVDLLTALQYQKALNQFYLGFTDVIDYIHGDPNTDYVWSVKFSEQAAKTIKDLPTFKQREQVTRLMKLTKWLKKIKRLAP